MSSVQKSEDLSSKIQVVFDKAIQKLIAEEKTRDGYRVVSNKEGHVQKIPAKDFKVR